MKRFRLVLFALGLVIFAGSGRSMVSAQSRLDDKDVQHILENLSGDSKSFRSTFVQALKQSSIRKTSRQKDADNLVTTFQKQTAGIADQFKHTKKVPGLAAVEATADQIEKLISELQLSGETTVKWQKIKQELAQTGSAFGFSPAPKPAGSSIALPLPLVRQRHDPGTLTIEGLKFGQVVRTKTIAVSVGVGKKIDGRTLRITLNGKDMMSRVEKGPCSETDCEMKVTLRPQEGLMQGWNRFRASALQYDKQIETTNVRFDYSTSALLGIADADQPQYLPMAVGFTLNAGGAMPWATVSTGYPAGVTDPIDRTLYSTPYPNTSLPATGQTSCSTPLQVMVLNRRQPNLMVSFTCIPDSATLTSVLSNTGNITYQNIVIVGTTPGSHAPANLDTSLIGGTNYSKTTAALYPIGYVMIGVGGAPTGSGFENYYTSSDLPIQYAAFATGSLVSDGEGNYNFHPGDNRPFLVSPNNASAGTSLITIGNQSYTAPAGSQNGFWLLTLDGNLLQPIDASSASGATCPLNAPSSNGCGKFYPTGSSDSTTATTAVSQLGAALSNMSPRTLALLTTVGLPFATPVIGSMGYLATGINHLGGSRYTLPKLTTASSTYTLVAPGIPLGGNNPAVLFPFDHRVVTSSTAYSAQGQTGIVGGVLARGLNGMFVPLTASQLDGQQNGTNASAVTPDFSYYQIQGQASTNWPLSDTPGHLAAYHYVSWWYLTKKYQETGGSFLLDVRSFYTQLSPDVSTSSKSLDCTQDPDCPTYPAGTNPQFTQQDFDDAMAALYKELGYYGHARGYLGGGGLRDLLTQADSNILIDMIAATYKVQSGQFGSSSDTHVSMKTTDWMSLASSVASIGSSVFGVPLPRVGAAIGVISGALGIGSAITSPWGPGRTNPPSYEDTFDTTLGNLDTYADQYTASFTASYDEAQESIYVDSGKLTAVGVKTEDTSSGWSSSYLQEDEMSQALSNGTSRALYLQLMPQFYALDTYPTQPVDDVTKIGTIYREYKLLYTAYCTATHSSLPQENFNTYAQIGYASEASSPHDIFVIGGTINNQGNKDVSESLPSQLLLDTLFAAPPNGMPPIGSKYLNFPKDMFFSTNQTDGGLLHYRPGPDQGFTSQYGNCYKPGCKATTGGEDSGAKECKGP